MLMRLRTHFLRGIIEVSLIGGFGGTAIAQLLYTPNYGTNNISEYATGSGPLTSIACSSPNPISVSPESSPEGLAMTPNGSFLYVSDNGAHASGISAYAVSGGPCVGKLTPLATGTNCPNASGQTCPYYSLPVGAAGPWGIAVDPNGSYLYVALQGSSTIAAYSINGTSGGLNYIGSYSTSTPPSPLVVAKVGSNEYLYAGLQSSVDVYPVQSNGALGTPTDYPLNGGDGSPNGLATFGSTLYVTDYNSSGPAGLYAFPILGSGLLGTPVTATTGAYPLGVAVDSSGSHVYVAGTGDSTVYSLLTSNLAAAPAVVTVNGGSSTVYGVAVDPTNDYVYVSDNLNNDIWIYSPGLASSVGSTFVGANTSPTEFILAHIPPPAPPAISSVPAASFTSLALLAILLAACAGILCRKSVGISSAQ
ncbi:MAG TPA: beta-propeller fold lactonase family protein [Bryobacteraceae bacterium]|nr:beta-propeller fold lactonase family protein [Bryobacteraceae bacterium]